MVAFGAQVQDRAAEEAELHADLHQDRQVAEGERLERGDGGSDVTAPAVAAREAHAGLARRGHLDHELTHPLAKRVEAELLGLVEYGRVRHEVRPDQVADLGVLAVEHLGQRPDVDVGLRVTARSSGSVVSGHAPPLPRPVTIKSGRPGGSVLLLFGRTSKPACSFLVAYVDSRRGPCDRYDGTWPHHAHALFVHRRK